MKLFMVTSVNRNILLHDWALLINHISQDLDLLQKSQLITSLLGEVLSI